MERAKKGMIGALVGLLPSGPLSFSGFKSPLVSFAVSCVIGVAAGLAIADDAGRRYLIGVGAAVEFAVFPVWFGFSLTQGSLDSHTVAERLGTFAVNLITIAGTAVTVYAVTGISTRDAKQLRKKTTNLS